MLDVLGALVLAPVALAITAANGALMRLLYREPPLFRQWRVGRFGREIVVVKLKTMHRIDGERSDRLEKQVFTRFGLMLRDRGLDEFPQLYNVLRGDMSLIGPRPLMPRDLARLEQRSGYGRELLTQWRTERERVRPGITGWHQVLSRQGELNWPQHDLVYLRDPSWARRLLIARRTMMIAVVGRRRLLGPPDPPSNVDGRTLADRAAHLARAPAPADDRILLGRSE